MKKAIKYAGYGTVLGAIAFGIVDGIAQHKAYSNQGKKFDLNRLLKAMAKGGLICGGGGLVVGAARDLFNELEEPIDSSAALLNFVEQNRLTKAHPEYIEGYRKVEVVRNMLIEGFGDMLMRRPEDYGSAAKGTALIGNSDFDLSALFRPEAFPTTGVMLHEVHDYLEENKQALGKSKVRLQGKSVGIEIKDGRKTTKIDVVPCRITEVGRNKVSGYLHKRKDTLFGTETSFTKTNIPLIKAQKLSATQQKLVVVLKCWKNSTGLILKGNLIEALVREAYICNRGKVPRPFADKLVMVWRFIADNLQNLVIRSIENTNNILTRISDFDKAAIISACKCAIEDYQYQPNSIVRVVKG